MDMCVLLTSTPFCLVSPRGDHEGAAFVIARRGYTTIIEINNRYCTVYLSGVAFKERLIMCTNFKTVRSHTRRHMHARNISQSIGINCCVSVHIWRLLSVYSLLQTKKRFICISARYVLRIECDSYVVLVFLFAFEQSITCIISQSERHLYIYMYNNVFSSSAK